ncbi:MFS transporter [Granulicella sp. 5B5]|uniref:MFS transporter n=1 Tax=Granulicella sp. 5B5 TaxID=1617967 RepID=UPI001756D072|nr:MFS transporter [Granulicella sp. 5B5]QMV20036.1 MFS transporter [Granulicella sp. 5B5]
MRPLEAALRKARWRLLPLLSICYLVAYMDRANISFAADTMSRDLGFTPKIYGLGAGLFFVSYALCEVPSNKLLLRFGARRWLARIMLTWGVLAAAMMFVHTSASFYGMRLLLGVAEAGYFPGVVYYLSQWFPPVERARALSRFYVAFPLSSVVMGAVAGALLRLNGRLHLHGWQWLFLVEGVPAVVLSVALWKWLPDGPREAAWLEIEEREALEAALHAGGMYLSHGSAEGALGRVLRDSRLWVLGTFYFFALGTSYALSFFLPSLLGALTQWPAGQVGWLISLGGVVSAGAMLLFAVSSDRTGERRWHVAGAVLAMGGLLLAAGLHMEGSFAAAALLLTAVAYSAMQGPLLALATTLVPGVDGALFIAAFNTFGIIGGFVGPYWMGWMRELTGGYAVGIGLLCVPCVVAGGCILWLTRERSALQA